MLKASDLFVKSLEKAGVKYIFGIPGEENLDFLDSLKRSKIKMIVTRHEQAAGFMAATVGRLTGKVGVCLSTLGPGATNFTTPAAYAQLGAMPMLMITGQKPYRNNMQGQFQIVDVVGMMKPLTKFTKKITKNEQISEILDRALQLAEEERQGPTHIELPEDIAGENTTSKAFNTKSSKPKPASKQAIQNAIKMIKGAKRPLLLLGMGANNNDLSGLLTAFVKKTGIYFLNTQMGKGAIDERSPQFLGTAALSANDHVHFAVEDSDLVIAIGHDVYEKPPFIMKKNGAKVIHINYYTSQDPKVYFPQLEVIGDVQTTLKTLTKSIKNQANWDQKCFKTVRDDVMQNMDAGSKENKFIPQRIIADIRKVMPDDGIITLDNGMYKIWFARHYRAYQSNTILLDNALATMGAGLPSAIAAKLLYPKRKIVAICGDGGFMMNSQELETAVRLRLDILVIILNDNAFGMIKWKQKNLGFKDYSLDLGNPNFIEYARSYGAHGCKVKDPNELVKMMKKCMNMGGVHLIEVPIDYSLNHIVSPQELKSNVAPCKINQ